MGTRIASRDSSQSRGRSHDRSFDHSEDRSHDRNKDRSRDSFGPKLDERVDDSSAKDINNWQPGSNSVMFKISTIKAPIEEEEPTEEEEKEDVANFVDQITHAVDVVHELSQSESSKSPSPQRSPDHKRQFNSLEELPKAQ